MVIGDTPIRHVTNMTRTTIGRFTRGKISRGLHNPRLSHLYGHSLSKELVAELFELFVPFIRAVRGFHKPRIPRINGPNVVMCRARQLEKYSKTDCESANPEIVETVRPRCQSKQAKQRGRFTFGGETGDRGHDVS